MVKRLVQSGGEDAKVGDVGGKEMNGFIEINNWPDGEV